MRFNLLMRAASELLSSAQQAVNISQAHSTVREATVRAIGWPIESPYWVKTPSENAKVRSYVFWIPVSRAVQRLVSRSTRVTQTSTGLRTVLRLYGLLRLQ